MTAEGLPNANFGLLYAGSASPADLNWLEDFQVLADLRNFSRAAEARHVTQLAFSRRIQALQTWVGTSLVRRSPQGVVLSAAGEYLLHRAADLTQDLQQMWRGVLRVAGRERAALAFAATHALSFTFLPGWVRTHAPLEALGTLNLVSDTMAACERILLAGEVDFFCCAIIMKKHRLAASQIASDPSSLDRICWCRSWLRMLPARPFAGFLARPQNPFSFWRTAPPQGLAASLKQLQISPARGCGWIRSSPRIWRRPSRPWRDRDMESPGCRSRWPRMTFRPAG